MVDDELAGYIALADKIREESYEAGKNTETKWNKIIYDNR